MEEDEREIWIGKNRLFLSKGNILVYTLNGEINKEIVIAMNEAALELADLVEGRVNVFVDLNNAGKSSPEARKIGSEYLSNEKYGKIAYFGLHPVARVLTSFFMGISKKKDMRYFKTKEEALAWLKGETET